MTIELRPTVIWLSFMVLCWFVGVLTTNLVLDDLANWWVSIPAVALLGFVARRAMRVNGNREQFFLAMLLATLVMGAVKQFWP